MSRRSALSGIGATAVVATASIVGRALPALGETLASDTSLIDVHHHFAPPAYVAENRNRVSPAALDWTPQKALDAMDAEGVATAVLSLALPASGSATPTPHAACQDFVMTMRPTLLVATQDDLACFRSSRFRT
jgi:hypothetical protein